MPHVPNKRDVSSSSSFLFKGLFIEVIRDRNQLYALKLYGDAKIHYRQPKDTGAT